MLRESAENVNHKAWFADDELHECGEPDYVELVGSRGLDVEAGSGSSEARCCPEHGVMSCPVCGSPMVEIEYKGTKARLLAYKKRAEFRGFVGCLRVDLHNKVVDGVNYSGKVYVRHVLERRI